jgi:hypothetical protein
MQVPPVELAAGAGIRVQRPVKVERRPGQPAWHLRKTVTGNSGNTSAPLIDLQVL